MRASRFFLRSEVLPARLLFATNPRTIPETTQNTSLFFTHPQQRPRTPRNELPEGHFGPNPSSVWPRTRNSTYFKIGLFLNFPSAAPPRGNEHRVKHGHTPHHVFPFAFAHSCRQSHVLCVLYAYFAHLFVILCLCAAICGRQFLSRVDISIQFYGAF